MDMFKRHMERCSTLLIIQGNRNQNHSKISPHWIAAIKESIDSKYHWECGEKETLACCCGECKLLQPLWKILRRLLKKLKVGVSLLVQWRWICLPMQETWFQSLIQEDPTGCRATKPMCHKYWACAPEPTSCDYWAHAPWSPCCARREATTLRRPCTTTTE